VKKLFYLVPLLLVYFYFIYQKSEKIEPHKNSYSYDLNHKKIDEKTSFINNLLDYNLKIRDSLNKTNKNLSKKIRILKDSFITENRFLEINYNYNFEEQIKELNHKIIKIQHEKDSILNLLNLCRNDYDSLFFINRKHKVDTIYIIKSKRKF
jgi:hypothetical protein